jgi:hypothetical protein
MDRHAVGGCQLFVKLFGGQFAFPGDKCSTWFMSGAVTEFVWTECVAGWSVKLIANILNLERLTSHSVWKPGYGLVEWTLRLRFPPKGVVVRFKVPHSAVVEDANLQRHGAVLLGECPLRFRKITVPSSANVKLSRKNGRVLKYSILCILI